MRREDRVSERKRKQHEQPAWPGAGLNGAGSREAVGPSWLVRLIGAREALTHLPIDRPPIVRGSTEGAIAEVPLDGRTAADCSEVRLYAKAHCVLSSRALFASTKRHLHAGARTCNDTRRSRATDFSSARSRSEGQVSG